MFFFFLFPFSLRQTPKIRIQHSIECVCLHRAASVCGNAIVSITSLPKHHTSILSLKTHFNIMGDDSLFNLWPFPPLSPALLGTVSILMIRTFALNIFSAEWRENRCSCQSFPIPCWTARPLTPDLWIDCRCELLGGYPVVACRLSAGLVQYGRQKPHTRTLMRERFS